MRLSVKFQGHVARKIDDFDPNWAFPDCFKSQMSTKLCTKLEVICQISRSHRPKNRRFHGFGSNLSDITRPVATIKSPRFALLTLELDTKMEYYRSSQNFWHEFRVLLESWICSYTPAGPSQYSLTHWGRVTHICRCVSKLSIIGSDNGLSPGRRQAIIWTNARILLIWPLWTIFSEILIEINTFSFKKMHLKMSFGKWRPFHLGLNVLISTPGPTNYLNESLYHLFSCFLFT